MNQLRKNGSKSLKIKTHNSKNNARIKIVPCKNSFFIFLFFFHGTLLSFSVVASEERPKAGLAAMKREHYATALRAFRAEADEGDPQVKIILVICMNMDFWGTSRLKQWNGIKRLLKIYSQKLNIM